MSDEKPDLNTTEMRQGNSRRMNLRALIFGIIILVIGFAIAVWFSSATYDETATTTQGGETVEENAPATEDPQLDESAVPVPEDSEDVVPTDDPPLVEEEPTPPQANPTVPESSPVEE